MVDGPTQSAAVAAIQPLHPVLLSSSYQLRRSSFTKRERGEHGNHRKGEKKRAEQCGTDRSRHGPEHASFESLQEKDGKVNSDDDDDGEGHGTNHFIRGTPDRFQWRLLAVTHLQTMNRVFHHHHGTVD